MDFTWFLIIPLFATIIYSSIISSKRDKQIKKMQRQINILYRLTGNEELIFPVLSDEEKSLLLQLKNNGKKIQAIKKIIELTHLDLVEAKNYFDSL